MIYESNNRVLITRADKIVDKSYSDAKYIDYFNEFIKKGIIETDKYESNTWCLINERKGRNKIDFKIKVFKDSLKHFVLYSLKYRKDYVPTIAKKIRMIIWGLEETENLSIDSINEIKCNLEAYNLFELRKFTYIEEFLEFIDDESYEDFKELFRGIKFKCGQLIREIPSYKSLLKFDYYINDFYNNAPTILVDRHLPILIWWKFSCIIPMRPTEIAELPYECLEEREGRYYLRINRIKGESNITIGERESESKHKNELYRNSYREQEIQLTKDIFDMFKRYEKLKVKEKRRFFFSYDFEYNNVYCGFYKWLEDFLDEIIKDYYNLEVMELTHEEIKINQVERPKLGDTRHIAFCGMMLQGFNPYTIMELGGHTKLISQLHYTNHMDVFVESSIQQLSESLTISLLNDSAQVKVAMFGRKNIRKLAELGDKFYELPVVEGGRCMSDNVPQSCPTTKCAFCEKYFVYDNDKEYLEILKFENEQEIESKLKYMKHIYGHTQDNSESDFLQNEKLMNNANSIKSLVKQRAIIDMYDRLTK